MGTQGVLSDSGEENYIPLKTSANYLFEVSWEVCNKVGGIYTVIMSKVGPMKEYYGNRYFTVGPFFPKKIAGVFEERAPPEEFKRVFEKLEREGIKCYYGRWLISGEPNTILIDYSGFTAKTNDIKNQLWQNFRIDSLGTQFHDFDEPMVWSYAAGKLIETFKNEVDSSVVVAQFHEWLSGGGLLYLKQRGAPVATVFTTHATMLGRSLSGHDISIYDKLDELEPDRKAFEFGIQAKHLTEKQCAMNADAFTTVSETTGTEASYLLGKKPDIILPNGLDISKFPTFEEGSIKHKLYKDRMKEFLLYYFFPYQSFDLEQTLFYFLCSRYEFHVKGMDIYIEALGRVNEWLKKEESEKTIVAFFWVPGNVRGIKQELLENKTLFEDVKDEVDDRANDIKNRVITLLVSQKEVNEKTLFEQDFLEKTKRSVLSLMKSGVPSLTTHDLYDEQSDTILNSFKNAGLLNRKEDRVKAIFYPIYLSGADGLLDLSYYEAIQGAHLGVFPSFYEPWGYTPLEAAALGVPSVTTDLSGFGRYIKEKGKRSKYPGIYILERMNKKREEEISALSRILYEYSQLSKSDRTKNKIEAKRLSLLADWQKLVRHYIEAHNLAVGRRFS
ncbi:MAG: glycosyltransferase [Candidatus Aenigmarchaeota archaeon]|nr:glycosyltransferase [Candidatus Aenigmarchaeota archaeon]